MENAIIENTARLLRSHCITALLFLCLIIAAVLVTVGVFRFKLIRSKAHRAVLSVMVAICSVGLILLQGFTIIPVYKDYTEQSYIVAEDAVLVVKDGSAGIVDHTNRVTLFVGAEELELKIQTDYSLDTEREYRGTVSYLKHSGYVIWYSVE